MHNFGFGIGQDLYTPKDITERSVQHQDRPYAGYLYISFKNISNSFNKESRLSSIYTIGIIGPYSFAKEVQRTFHAFRGSNLPLGWHNQIATDIGLNLNINFEKRIISPIEFLDLIGFINTNILSTISNNFSAGLHYRIGLFNDYFTNITATKPDSILWNSMKTSGCTYYCNAVKRDWQFYVYIKSSIYSTLDNSFLEGGILNRSSVHSFHPDDIKRFYFQGEYGLRVSSHGMDIIYAQVFRSPEFKNANNSYWGKIQFIFSY